jgi:hypothetical protein
MELWKEEMTVPSLDYSEFANEFYCFVFLNGVEAWFMQTLQTTTDGAASWHWRCIMCPETLRSKVTKLTPHPYVLCGAVHIRTVNCFGEYDKFCVRTRTENKLRTNNFKRHVPCDTIFASRQMPSGSKIDTFYGTKMFITVVTRAHHWTRT